MNLHEYQSKKLLGDMGLPVPRGFGVFTQDEAREKAKELGGEGFVVKAQIHAGGRGAGHFEGDESGKGGVRICKTLDEVAAHAGAMLGHTLITKQTGPQGKKVNRIYVEELGSIAEEFYLSMLVDRGSGKVAIVASKEGGMSIEEVAEENPDAIHTLSIDPATGIMGHHARALIFAFGLKGDAAKEMLPLCKGLYEAFIKMDASLIEINPLVLTKDNHLVLMDAKVSLDDNALARHKDLELLRDISEENPVEYEATQEELNYIKLDGNIGCMVNGAGLAMATMDSIQLYGGEPANFLDVGGGAPKERVKKAFEVILSDKDVKGILVNIFGGIMRCDIIAEGILAAVQELDIGELPLVVRLEGTNVEKGKALLSESGLAITSAVNLGDAARKVVTQVQKLSS